MQWQTSTQLSGCSPFSSAESFFRHHNFPEGYSLMVSTGQRRRDHRTDALRQLKYYGKGHLVNAFMEEPAERKLRGVEAVMNSFPESKFILVGDSGEQESVHVPCSCIAVLTLYPTHRTASSSTSPSPKLVRSRSWRLSSGTSVPPSPRKSRPSLGNPQCQR